MKDGMSDGKAGQEKSKVRINERCLGLSSVPTYCSKEVEVQVPLQALNGNSENGLIINQRPYAKKISNH